MLNRLRRFTWLLDQLLLVAGILVALQALLPKPVPPPGFFWAALPAGWLALIVLRLLRRWRVRFSPWFEISCVVALVVGGAIHLTLQQLYLFTVWPGPTAFCLGTCILGWLALTRIAGLGAPPEARDNRSVHAWMDVAVLAIVLWGASALQEGAPVRPWLRILIIGAWTLLGRLPRLSANAGEKTLIGKFGRLALTLAGAFLIAGAAAGSAGSLHPLASLPGLFAASFVALAIFHVVKHQLDKTATDPVTEVLSLVLLLAAGGVLVSPVITFHPVGAGDAGWYATMLRDAITQFRAGVFPVYIGQTQDAFNGSIFPFALAPYFLHFGGLLDLLTFHSLEIFAVMHLAAALSLLGGMFVMHHAVRKLNPGQPLLAVGIAWIYGSGAAMLSPLYTADMYMTQMALPWVPLAFYFCFRIATRPTRAAWVGVGASLGILCWAHLPDAIWTGFVCTGPLLTWIVVGPERRRNLAGALWAGLAFAGISLGYFTRILSVLERTGGDLGYLTDAVMLNIHSVMPAALLPVSAQAAQTGDFQLGYSLWVLLLFAGLFCWRRGQSAARGLVIPALVLLVMVIPVSSLLTESLWRALPSRFIAASDVWPMMRLYLVIAPVACLVGSMAWTHLASRPRLAPFLPLAVGLMMAWNALEAGKFLARGRLVTNPASSASAAAFEANHRLTTNSFYPYFPGHALPYYYSESTVDPVLALRLLNQHDPKVVLRANEPAPIPVGRTIALHAQAHSLWPVIVGLTPQLVLPPHSHWIVRLHFSPRNYQGQFHLQGQWINRQYPVATSDGQILSGWSASPARTIMLGNDQDEAEVLTLRYYPAPNTPIPQLPPDNSTVPPESSLFAEVEMLPYRADDFPVAIESFLPLRLRVDAPEAAMLETFRIAVPGYRARVNGQAATTQISRDSLVIVPVPAGRSVVELEYRPSWFTRAANWLSLAVALFLAVNIFRRLRGIARNFPQPAPPAPVETPSG